MKAILNRKTIVIAAIAVIIAIIAIVSVNVFNSVGPVNALVNAVTSPVRSLVSSVARTFENIYSAIYKYEILQKEYDDAMSELDSLRRAYRESDELLRDNDRLRELNDFRKRHTGLVNIEEAMVESMSSNNFTSSFIINKGHDNSDKPIARGNSVITQNGVLIGQISEVSANKSTVISVIDTTFSAGAYVGDGEDSVTAKGDFTLMSSGLLMLDHLNEDLVVLPGDSVVTSGKAGVFPVGLVIGEVIEVLRHSTGVGRYATVRPMRAIDITIVDVYVITSFDAAN